MAFLQFMHRYLVILRTLDGHKLHILRTLLTEGTGISDSEDSPRISFIMTLMLRLKVTVCKCSRSQGSISWTSYPYTTDFDMILSTLHQLEDADGVPHTELCPKKFSEVPDDILSIGDVSYNQFESICASYADKINKKMKEHVEGLDAAAADSAADSAESPQRAAQQRVRAALKNSVPYIESIVRQVLNWNYHSSAEKVPQHHRMRMYGYPTLPSKEYLKGTFRRVFATRVRRGDSLYNMMYFIVPRHMYGACAKLNGPRKDGGYLVVRCSDVPLYKGLRHCT
ncbi:hypothetical protein ACJJTC_018859 [Scirpophaga incertulas]